MKIGRQADPDYKRPETKQHPSSPSASSAGFAGGSLMHSIAAPIPQISSNLKLRPEHACMLPHHFLGHASATCPPFLSRHGQSDQSLTAGGGAGAHAEEGVKTGRQADPAYRRPQPEAQPSSPSATAGFAGELWACCLL